MTSLLLSSSSSVCLPRFATAATSGRESFGPLIGAMARVLGTPLMPWQQLVADVGGELDPVSGLPAYRQVVVSVPRQSGKTALMLAWEIQRAVGWFAGFGAQRIMYSAQDGSSARKKLVNDQFPVLKPRMKALGIAKLLGGIGNEGAVFANGSRIDVMSSSEDSGHGTTIDLAVVDELFADKDDRRFMALRPAMATKPFGQMLVASTMGTDESTTLNRLVARGRRAVESGENRGIAYFEWSAAEDADPDDPATWWSCMPALGHTQSIDIVRADREQATDGEFRRASLNQQTRSSDRVLPAAEWDAVCDLDASPGAGTVFAVDVNPDRSAASIVAASGGAVPTCELVEHRDGVGWLVGRCVELSERWGRPSFTVDGVGPAASMVPALESAGVRVVKVPAREMVDACGAFYDRVLEGRVRVRRHLDLDAAAAGATKRQSGDAWAWARKHPSVDVSPLVAATLAVWAASGKPSVVAAFVDPNAYPDGDDDDDWS